MENKVKYDITIDENSKISVSKGNSKLGKGVFVFNLLPGDEPIKLIDTGALTNVRGTCQGCCDGCVTNCYAMKDARRYHNSCIPALVKNTLMMRADINNVFKQIKEFIDKKHVQTWRWHSSGEIETYDYLLKMVELAKETPNVKFYFYTKRIEFVKTYLNSAEGKDGFPANLTCNISAWHNLAELEEKLGKENIKKVNFFIYDDGDEPELAKYAHCPAVAKAPGAKKGHKTDKTCTECGICYSKNNGHKICVHNH